MIAWGLVGFAATAVLTSLLAGAQALGLTRMSLPYLLGMIFTPDRDRAKGIGVLVHLVNGWIFSAVYLAAFAAAHGPSVALGCAIGLVHGVFVGAVALPVMPAFHPRIARPYAGPTAERRLEPPGFFGRNYGWSTGAVLVGAHVVFGALLALGAALAR